MEENNENVSFEEIEKRGRGKKFFLITLFVVVVIGICVFAFYLGTNAFKNNDNNDGSEEADNNTDNDAEEGSSESVDANTISVELRADLDKKVSLTAHYVTTALTYDANTVNNVFSKNEDDYDYFALRTYDYYLYKTGATKEKYSTKDAKLSTCYEQSQNGYCYVVDKTMLLKYNQELYNVSADAFNTGMYTTTRDDKIYVTPIPWNGADTTKVTEVVSVEKKDDVIEYVAKHTISEYTSQSDGIEMTIKYIFKVNNDGNYYLYSFEKISSESDELKARSEVLKNNFNKLMSGNFDIEKKEYKFSNLSIGVYKVKDATTFAALIDDTFIDHDTAWKYVPYYEKDGVYYSAGGSGGFQGAGYYIFQYFVSTEKSATTASVTIEYIECYDSEHHDTIAACQNNPVGEISTMEFNLKKVNDKWLIESMVSEIDTSIIK